MNKIIIRPIHKFLSTAIFTVGVGLMVAPAMAEGVDPVIQNIVEKGDLKKSLEAQNNLMALSSNASNPKAEAKIQEELEQAIVKALPTATPWVQQVLLRQLALIGTDKCIDGVKMCLKSEDGHLRDEARKTLQHLGGDLALTVLLKEMPKAKNEVEQQGYVQTLGTFQNAKVVPLLSESLNHKNPLIARAAISALGHIHLPEALSILLKSKTTARDELKNELDLAIINHKSATLEDVKNLFLNSNGLAKVRALQILCENGRVEASLINAILAEKNPLIKPALLKVCAQDSKACELLLKEESKWSGMDIVPVFTGLSESHNKSKEDWVLKYVTSDKEMIQTAAIRALPPLASSKSLLPLVSQLSNKNAKVKEAASEALQALHGSDFAPLLIKSYSEGNLEQKNVVLRAISYCVIPQGSDLCIKMIESQEPFSSKIIALQTLCSIGGLEDLKKLLNWLNQSEDDNEIKVFTSAAKKVHSRLKGDTELAVIFEQSMNLAKSDSKKAIFTDIFVSKENSDNKDNKGKKEKK